MVETASKDISTMTVCVGKFVQSRNRGGGRHRPELPADGRDFHEPYRTESRRLLRGRGSGSSGKDLAMVSILAPVSMAVELETLVTRSRRYRSRSLRYGLVSIRGFFNMV